jgi:hypothetical protein
VSCVSALIAGLPSMRLRLRADCSGAVRLSLLPDLKDAPKVEPPEPRNLVYGDELQDCIYADPKAPPVGFGRSAEKRSFTRTAKARIREFGAVLDAGPLGNC